MRKQHLEAQLKALPAKPGVYVFRGEDGRVLYIGKAKSLRPRVRSYFQATPDTRAQIAQLPGRVADLRVFFGRATRPSSRITAATVFSLTVQPASRRSAVIRGDP